MEIKRHISRAAKKSVDRLSDSLRNYLQHWPRNPVAKEFQQSLGVHENSDALACRQFSKFKQHVGATIIPFDKKLNFRDLLNRYFETKSPFEEKKDKKSEFPDAIALLNLEAWANDNRSWVLVVSCDGGWKKYSEESQYLICIETIDEALDLFNEAGRIITERVVEKLRSKAARNLIEDMTNKVQEHLDENGFEIEPDILNIHLFDELEGKHAEVLELSVSDNSDPRVIEIKDETVTISIEIDCLIEFSANFYTFATYSKEIVERTVPLSAVVTVPIEVNPESRLVEADITTPHIRVNFGNLEQFPTRRNHIGSSRI